MCPEPLKHRPVLQITHADQTATSVLRPKEGDIVLDCTLGFGGHTEAFLEQIGSIGHVYGIDADAQNLALARNRLEPHLEQVTFIHANFRHLGSLYVPSADIIFADLGLSSMHVDEAERGFSFRFNGPLDMRFDRTRGLTVSEFLHEAKEDEIKRILKQYGELKETSKLAHVIWQEARRSTPKHLTLQTTEDLKILIESIFDHRTPMILPQIFQAFRMHVNDELGALAQLLDTAPTMLKPNGRLGIITFHSLEDRMVKHAFRKLTTAEKDPVTGQPLSASVFELLTKKPIAPTDEEIALNPRARSALFRVIQKR